MLSRATGRATTLLDLSCAVGSAPTSTAAVLEAYVLEALAADTTLDITSPNALADVAGETTAAVLFQEEFLSRMLQGGGGLRGGLTI